MKKLVLNEWESNRLRIDGAVEIARNGFTILLERDDENDFRDYMITIKSPYDKVVIKEPRSRKNWHI